MKIKTRRTLSVLFGWLIWSFSVTSLNLSRTFGANPSGWSYFLWILGAGLSIYGFYLWAKIKNRSGFYALLAILTPISIPIMVLIKSRSAENAVDLVKNQQRKFEYMNCKDCRFFDNSKCTRKPAPTIDNGYCLSFEALNRREQ